MSRGIFDWSPHFAHQFCEYLDMSTHITAVWLFQCTTMGIMNGQTGLRLEIIAYNAHCKLTFEAWVGIYFWLTSSSLWVFGYVHSYQSCLTVPIYHYGYNGWSDRVEIGIHCLQCSLQSDFWVISGDIFLTEVFILHTKSVSIWICPLISQQLDCSNVSL